MGSLIQRDKDVARRKGTWAAAALGGAVFLGVTGSPILATGAAVGAVYLGWKWFMFRAKRGMRF